MFFEELIYMTEKKEREFCELFECDLDEVRGDDTFKKFDKMIKKEERRNMTPLLDKKYGKNKVKEFDSFLEFAQLFERSPDCIEDAGLFVFKRFAPAGKKENRLKNEVSSRFGFEADINRSFFGCREAVIETLMSAEIQNLFSLMDKDTSNDQQETIEAFNKDIEFQKMQANIRVYGLFFQKDEIIRNIMSRVNVTQEAAENEYRALVKEAL